MVRVSRSRSRSASGGSRSRSRSPSPRYLSGSRSPSGSPPRSRSPLDRGSRSRSRSRSKSRSRSRSQGKSSGGLAGVALSYDDFTPADEEKPTFALDQVTIDLITSKVYHASPLNKKFFNELKREKYMMAREVNESLEPKPIPAQVVSSVGGYDLNKLHGGLLHQHKVNRLAQRPIWALMEELQKSRILLKDAPPTQFNSPPYMGTGALPDGFVPLDFSVEEERRHAAQAPNDPSSADFADVHKRLGVHIKYHGEAERAMQSMVNTIKMQQELLGHMKLAHDAMWVRSQDYLNMARYQETHLKEMRRSQLVKAHTRDFNEWLDTVYMKDKSKLGDRDRSDEILAANYDAVINQYKEDRKNKNIALKQSGSRGRDWYRRGGGSGSNHSRDGGNHSRDGGNHSRGGGNHSSDRHSAQKPKDKPDYKDKGKEKKGSGRGKTSQGGRGGGKGSRNDGSGDNNKGKTV